MGDVLEAQKEGRFSDISERDKEIQASVWALLFLVSELALGFRALRDRLNERGVLQPDDEAAVNEAVMKTESLQAAYAQVEQAFQDKFHRVRLAMEHPDEVTEAVNQTDTENTYGGTSIDLNDVSEKIPQSALK